MKSRLYRVPDGMLRLMNRLFFSAVSREWDKGKITDDDYLNQVIKRSAMGVTDISSHLAKIYLETLNWSPELIVELGVRSGESTFALNMAARKLNAAHVSVDIEDCSGVITDPNWRFIQGDDIELSGRFSQWVSDNKMKLTIDLLFIDTSHEYHHTKKELQTWFPMLSQRAMVIFHDTYSPKVVRMPDGSFYPKVNRFPQNDVANALNEYFSADFPWNRPFIHNAHNWYIEHDPTSFGLTFLKRWDSDEQDS